MSDDTSGAVADGGGAAVDVALTEEQKKQVEAYEVEKQLAASQEEAIKAKKAVVDAQKELAVSELALASAQLPESDVTPPTGEVTGDAAGYMAELIAYQAMDRGAQKIADEINGLPAEKMSGSAKILLTENMQIAPGDYPRLLAQLQFDYYDKSLDHLRDKIASFGIDIGELTVLVSDVPEAEIEEEGLEALALTPLAALTLAPQVLGAAATVLSYFKTSYTVKSKSVTLEDSALRAAVAGKLEKGIVTISDFHLVEKSDFLSTFVLLLDKRYSLDTNKEALKENVIAPLKVAITELDEQLAELEAGKEEEKRKELAEKKQAFEEEKEAAEQVVAEAEQLIQKFDEFYTLLLASENDQTPLLVQAAVQDHIKKSGISHLLFLHIESKGGEEMSKKTLWTKGGDTAFLGGVAASYVLAKTDGEVVSAGTIVSASEMHRKIGDSNPPKVKAIKMYA